MSVTTVDHRRFVEGKIAAAVAAEAAKPKQLLVQEPTSIEVGDEKLDKMLRAVAAKQKMDMDRAPKVAEEIAGAVQEELVRLKQFEYFYTKGRIDAFKEVSLMPAQIMLEAKPITE